jgi:DoxX-like family
MKAKYIYWIATGLLCLGYFGGAGLYLTQHEMVAGIYAQLGYPAYLIYVLIVVKILGPIAILTRRSIALSDLAYAGMFFHLLLALSAHLNSGVPGWQPAAVMFVALLVSFFTQNAVRQGVSPHAGAGFGASG